MKHWLTLALTIGLALLLGVTAAQPPAPLPATAPATEFSAARAMADIRVIATWPHPTGSAADAAVRAHLVARLVALGFTVRSLVVPLPPRPAERLTNWSGTSSKDIVATSLVAVRAGRDSTAPAVALMAHHDSVWGSPGAADDAMGVASTLEIARAIPRATQARDLVILLTDAEELGLVGARAFFGRGAKGQALGTADPLAARIGVVIDMESRGGGGRAMMFETGRDNGAMVDLFARVVHDPAATSLAVKIYELLPNSTDFTPVKQSGIPGFNFAMTGRADLYHSPLSKPDAISAASLQHMGGQALDLTRALVTAPQLPGKAPDQIFSDVLGQSVIAYPVGVGWGLIIAIAGLIAVAAVWQRRQWRLRGLLAGAIDGLVAALKAGVLLYGFNLLSGADKKSNYYDRLAALPRLEGQALLLVIAGILLTLVLVASRRGRWHGWLGLALLNLLLVVVIEILLPAAGPVLAWPLLLAVAAMASVAVWPRSAPVMPMLAAIPSLAFIGGFGHFSLLAVGAGLPSAVAAFVPMALLLLWPLIPPLPRRGTLIAAGLVLLLAGSIALWVRLDPMAPSVPPYADKG